MTVRLGLRANAAQFSLLVALNALVGGLAGLERSVLPLVGARDFGLAAKSAVLSFIVAFGAAKALANLASGGLARHGRKRVLLAGWLLALPVPALLALAPSWAWIVGANVLLGASQGLAWSMTVLMKIDLAGPARRGLALGLNESAGYLGVAGAAFATGVLAQSFAPRTVVWAGAAALALAGTLATAFLVRETRTHVELEHALEPARASRGIAVWAQAGFVNNLNDALAWGLLPLYLAARGASTEEIGAVAALYPAVWGAGQIGAGWLSDRVGRTPLVAAGMAVQAGALLAFLRTDPYLAAALLGAGTALVYPTLLAAVSDAVAPRQRARALGRYRFWRDTGLVAGAGLTGVLADSAGSGAAIAVVAALTALSGAIVFADARHRELPLGRWRGRAYGRPKPSTEETLMNGKVVVNLATGLEDAERVTIAFLIAGAALEQGKQVTMFLTKDAVRLGLPGHAEGVACDGCPPLERLFQQFADGGGELLVCPICFNARKLDEGELVANAKIGGATPLWQWVGDGATVFSY